MSVNLAYRCSLPGLRGLLVVCYVLLDPMVVRKVLQNPPVVRNIDQLLPVGT